MPRCLIILLLLVAACDARAEDGAPLPSPAPPVGIADFELFGTALSHARWATTTNRIPVCWENPQPQDASGRAVVKRAIEETWQRRSAVKFDGWGACEPLSNGIHIKVANELPHTKAIGRYLNRYPSGMVLNFRPQNLRDWRATCQSQPDFCIYASAVHEFGHALGFTHEQNRNDAPVECRGERAGTVGDYYVTTFDLRSIMSYCNPNWLGNGQLSELDVQAVQRIYGRPRP